MDEILYQGKECNIVLRGTYYVTIFHNGANERFSLTLDEAKRKAGLQ